MAKSNTIQVFIRYKNRMKSNDLKTILDDIYKEKLASKLSCVYDHHQVKLRNIWMHLLMIFFLALSINTFYGSGFVRSVDLLVLPNINPDAAFGIQVAIEDKLANYTSVTFQAALLYTSSKSKNQTKKLIEISFSDLRRTTYSSAYAVTTC